jgi:hypothetical protein
MGARELSQLPASARAALRDHVGGVVKGVPKPFAKAALRKALTECRSVNVAALELDTTPDRVRAYIGETNDPDLKRLYIECRERGYSFKGGRAKYAPKRPVE